jgi:hypothetical protein
MRKGEMKKYIEWKERVIVYEAVSMMEVGK